MHVRTDSALRMFHASQDNSPLKIFNACFYYFYYYSRYYSRIFLNGTIAGPCPAPNSNMFGGVRLVLTLTSLLSCVQTLLKTVRLLCITISVGRSRSVKNVADTKLFAARSLQKASTDVFQGPPPQQCTKRRPQNQEGLNCNDISSYKRSLVANACSEGKRML
jgi:hypothetical protein